MTRHDPAPWRATPELETTGVIPAWIQAGLKVKGSKMTRQKAMIPATPRIAIDIDNTLLVQLNPGDEVVINEDVRDLIRTIWRLEIAEVWLWSGGGADYAAAMGRRAGIDHMVTGYADKTDGEPTFDITVDDQEITLGTVNLKLAGDIEPTPYMGIGS